MVPHLQHLDVAEAPSPLQGSQDLLLGISGEERVERTNTHVNHQAGLVRGRILDLADGPENVQRYPAHHQPRASRHLRELGGYLPQFIDRRPTVLQCAAADERSVHRYQGGKRLQPAVVVVVQMRDDDRVEPADSPPQESGA